MHAQFYIGASRATGVLSVDCPRVAQARQQAEAEAAEASFVAELRELNLPPDLDLTPDLLRRAASPAAIASTELDRSERHDGGVDCDAPHAPPPPPAETFAVPTMSWELGEGRAQVKVRAPCLLLLAPHSADKLRRLLRTADC